jgi:hypothetical protein
MKHAAVDERSRRGMAAQTLGVRCWIQKEQVLESRNAGAWKQYLIIVARASRLAEMSRRAARQLHRTSAGERIHNRSMT